MTRRPSPQQLTVLRAYAAGEDPLRGLVGAARRGCERTVGSLVARGWLTEHTERWVALHERPQSGTVTRRELTAEGRRALGRAAEPGGASLP